MLYMSKNMLTYYKKIENHIYIILKNRKEKDVIFLK